MLKALPILVYVALMIFAMADMLQRPTGTTMGVPKWVWSAIIVLVPFLGALGWIIMSRSGPNPAAPPAARPVAPDDDPEYLAWLRDQTRRKRGKEG